MDSFELNKIAAAVFLAGATAVGGSIAVNSLYGGEAGHHHGDHEPKRGYRIEGVEMAATGADDAPKIPQIANFFADASLSRGQSLAKACVACHSFDKGGPHKVGPALWDVVGAPIGRHKDYSYSNALASFGGEWDYQALSEFLTKPRKYVDGTKMAYAGMRKPEDRASILLYLQSLSDSPVALPEPELEEEVEAEAAAESADASESSEANAADDAAPAATGE